MTADFLFRLILGHCFGDFVFQNNWMALNKERKFLPVFFHCLIYTVCVCGFCMIVNPVIWALVFLSHFVLDGTKAIDVWLDIIYGRSYYATECLCEREEVEFKKYYHRANSALVHCAADNTIHLFLLYVIFSVLLF